MTTPYRPAIYTITNSVTGRTYVGQSLDYKGRWTRHVRDLDCGVHTNEYLQRSWLKYGKAAFTFKVETCLSEHPRSEIKVVMNEAEKAVMAKYSEIYNLREGGKSGRVNPETKAKIKEANRVRMQDPEYRKWWTKITNDARSNPEIEAKRLAAVHTGQRTPEARARRSELSKKAWSNPSHVQKVSAAIKEAWNNPEKRAEASRRMSEQCAKPEMKAVLWKRWQDPAHREMMTAIHVAKWQDPEYRAKQMAKRALRWQRYWESKSKNAGPNASQV
jgi:group I intron endonuclease